MNKQSITQEQIKLILGLLRNSTSLNGVEIMKFSCLIKDNFNIISEENKPIDSILKDTNLKFQIREKIRDRDKLQLSITEEELLNFFNDYDKKQVLEYISQLLQDGEIYENKPKCFRWLG